MHCGSVQIDCRCCLRAKVSSLSVEIQRGDVVFTAYAYEHGAVLNPFCCVVSHTFDCSPCSPRNNAVLRWPIEGNTWLFPLPEPSGFNAAAPILNRESMREFRKRPELQQNMRVSFLRMMKFYGLEVAKQIRVTRAPNFTAKATIWLSPGNHNHLRITRILRCLCLLDWRRRQEPSSSVCLRFTKMSRASRGPRSALRRFGTGGKP